jgi:hypothetical protein
LRFLQGWAAMLSVLFDLLLRVALNPRMHSRRPVVRKQGE